MPAKERHTQAGGSFGHTSIAATALTRAGSAAAHAIRRSEAKPVSRSPGQPQP
jgi:hypothetical protein